jgi:uncharacterized protein (DUF488 family)
MTTEKGPAMDTGRVAGEIYTIGHSIHPAEQFLALLLAHEVRQVADIRTVPKSRRHPQFNRDALDRYLHTHGIGYRHFPALGGLRKPRPDSINTGWRHPGFRGYADHMETAEFSEGLEALLAFADGGRTTVMCAEAVWWQCHRQLLADALVARGIGVRHILGAANPKPHHLSDFARLDNGRVSYPGLL